MYGVKVKWNPKDVEIKTRTVEKTLEPLVIQVTTLVNADRGPHRRKGRSKRPHVLVSAVEQATKGFIEKGKVIAEENPDIREEMTDAVNKVEEAGMTMSTASREFADDPCSSLKRSGMVRAARALLSAVTRMLVLADMVDVALLMNSLKGVGTCLDNVRAASSEHELVTCIRELGRNVSELLNLAAKRQQDLKDPDQRDQLAAARAMLKKHSTLLLTSSKVYIRHPELPAAREVRDYILRQVCEAVDTISDITEGRVPGKAQRLDQLERPGELEAALVDFDSKINMSPAEYNEVRMRPSLEEQLESIISGAALLADSSCTRTDRRDRIVAECNNVRQALQDLLSEYMANMGRKNKSDNLEDAIEYMNKKTKDLRRQLRKAVVDHVSDEYMETNMPLYVMIEAAKAGDEAEVQECAQFFTEHAKKLTEVAHMACSMSENEEGVKMVRLAAAQIDELYPQVINAARILMSRPNSKVALQNMDMFKDMWLNQVRLLTEAVDEITTIDDFLAVSENHILEDVNRCVMALQEGDSDTLDRTASAIHGRLNRVCNVVRSEMDNYEPGFYTERVVETINVLGDKVSPHFKQETDNVLAALTSSPQGEVAENEFIDAARLVYDGVTDVRRAVLMIRAPEELDSDTEIEHGTQYDSRSKTSGHTTDAPSTHGDYVNFRSVVSQLNPEDKERLKEQVEVFKSEKLIFDREVAKWDDSSNDIVVVAKRMCMIMMEMTDFTRGRGPLRSTSDVINAAKKISEQGTNLDKLAREIAEHCPESKTKKDLISDLQAIDLYCHQLNITSKVKDTVQDSIGGNLTMTGLDSAMSLIQAAKNLMNAVVRTVKTSYVASTKYNRANPDATRVVWKMKAPEKKPLVRPERQEEVKAKVRKGSQKKRMNPIMALSEFQVAEEDV